MLQLKKIAALSVYYFYHSKNILLHKSEDQNEPKSIFAKQETLIIETMSTQFEKEKMNIGKKIRKRTLLLICFLNRPSSNLPRQRRVILLVINILTMSAEFLFSI